MSCRSYSIKRNKYKTNDNLLLFSPEKFFSSATIVNIKTRLECYGNDITGSLLPSGCLSGDFNIYGKLNVAGDSLSLHGNKYLKFVEDLQNVPDSVATTIATITTQSGTSLVGGHYNVTVTIVVGHGTNQSGVVASKTGIFTFTVVNASSGTQAISSVTQVYQRPDNALKIRYYDNSDVLQIVDIDD